VEEGGREGEMERGREGRREMFLRFSKINPNHLMASGVGSNICQIQFF